MAHNRVAKIQVKKNSVEHIDFYTTKKNTRIISSKDLVYKGTFKLLICISYTT